jgi:AbrB family looped-hinge helix DNA binding protein
VGLVGMKTITITERGQIALPKEVRRGKFSNGKKVVVLTFEDKIELRPIEHVNEKLLNTLLSEKSLMKNWNTKEEDKAWKKL